MRLWAFCKYVFSRFCAITQYCHRCGRYAEAYMVPDEVWLRIVNDSSQVLCVRCFDKQARRVGIYPSWGIEQDPMSNKGRR